MILPGTFRARIPATAAEVPALAGFVDSRNHGDRSGREAQAAEPMIGQRGGEPAGIDRRHSPP